LTAAAGPTKLMVMVIRTHCPSGHLLEVDAHCAGLRVRCGRCGKVFRVPAQLHPGDADLVPKLPNPKILKSPTHLSAVLPPPDAEIEATSLVVGAMVERTIGRTHGAGDDFSGSAASVPQGVYEAPPSQIRAVWWLAAELAALVLVSLAPLAWTGEIDLAAAPPWAQAVFLVAGLQLFHIAWMLNGPDWASVRMVMFLFAAVAAGYAVVTTTVMATPLDYPLSLGLGPVRQTAAAWCAAVVLLMSLGTFLAGRLATHWQRSFQEEMYSSRSA
jgi:hypothetical protein